MININKAILAPLIYYDMLDRPLTELEIFKYLPATDRGVSFFDLTNALKNLTDQKEEIESKNGLFFLKGRVDLIEERTERLKVSQIKWKTLKKSISWLALAPFINLIAITGSLTLYNARPSSDFDLLIIVRQNRLWLCRTLLTALIGFLGIRRHKQFIANRLCLNCYLTTSGLEIDERAKSHNFHSAQEYGRLTPVLELKNGLYEEFTQKNIWLKNSLNIYPWSNNLTIKKIIPGKIFSTLRRLAEWLLNGKIGDLIEKKLGQWQKKRIQQKTKTEPANQIYISDNCLMLHPQSKSYEIIKKFNIKMTQLK